MTSPAKPRSRVLRGFYLVLGLICVGFAYMSWLPGIPTFDFVILAAFFFARSSDRFHTWLIGHPFFGRIIAGYREGGFTVRAKDLDLGGTGAVAGIIDRGLERCAGVSSDSCRRGLFRPLVHMDEAHSTPDQQRTLG